jgi:hypothetical protein
MQVGVGAAAPRTSELGGPAFSPLRHALSFVAIKDQAYTVRFKLLILEFLIFS